MHLFVENAGNPFYPVRLSCFGGGTRLCSPVQLCWENALNDSLGESEETKLWLDFALDCEYTSANEHKKLTVGYEQVSAMLWTLMTKWETFR